MYTYYSTLNLTLQQNSINVCLTKNYCMYLLPSESYLLTVLGPDNKKRIHLVSSIDGRRKKIPLRSAKKMVREAIEEEHKGKKVAVKFLKAKRVSASAFGPGIVLQS